MTDHAELIAEAISEIIAKLEAATEGSRELDLRIEYALHDERDFDAVFNFSDPKILEWEITQVAAMSKFPAYTTSLDAALTLLEPVNNAYRWCSIERWATGRGKVAVLGSTEYYEAATPALALCIAALRAREK